MPRQILHRNPVCTLCLVQPLYRNIPRCLAKTIADKDTEHLLLDTAKNSLGVVERVLLPHGLKATNDNTEMWFGLIECHLEATRIDLDRWRKTFPQPWTAARNRVFWLDTAAAAFHAGMVAKTSLEGALSLNSASTAVTT